MYLKRKIDLWFDKWKAKTDKKPALITGIRQCGKTESILHFANSNYSTVIYINFWENKNYLKIFDNSLDVEDLVSNISLYFLDKKIIPNKTVFIFDEIQECPRARLSLKNFAINGKYDVIASGSFLGVSGYVINDTTPIPVGYEDIFQMKTLDFEEFLWANHCDNFYIEQLEKCFKNRIPVPDPLNNYMKKMFQIYLCIGGFPRSVTTYLETKIIGDSVNVVTNIVSEMKHDLGRRININGESIFKQSEIGRIQNVFELIPAFLAKENKRFVASKIITGNGIDKANAIEYLKQAGIISKVFNLTSPSLPLEINKISNQFKLFPNDIGMLISMLGNDTIAALSQGNLGLSKGAIYEALVFDSLYKSNIEVYYFAKESGLEIDFVICYEAKATLLEVKAKNGNSKSAKTVLSHPQHYGKTRLIKIGDYNISENDNVLTIPHYLTFILGKH